MPPKKAAAVKKAATKPVFATLLSGFLGSGKTSLMRHVLANKEGLRCAVVVNEISELNLDADALAGTKLIRADEKLVEMANGCICCTLREDLLKQLRELATSGKFDCVLIESSGIAEPMQTAEAFFVDLNDGNGQLQEVCALDNCVTVVDASTFNDYMGRIDTVSSIDAKAKESEDDRDIAQLFVDQLEFANVVVLNKTDLIRGPDREAKINGLIALIKSIAPQAKIINAVHSKVPLKEILQTGNFTLEFANGNTEWMEDIKGGVKHVPETLEYGVSSYMFRADKAFHPKRLYDWITTNFVLNQMKVLDDEEDSAIPGASTKEEKREILRQEEERKLHEEMLHEAEKRKKHRVASYGNLFRGKGFIWIGSPERSPLFGVWSQAGTLLSLMGGDTWDELPQPSNRAAKANKRPQQLLQFVGQHLNAKQLESDLRDALLTEAEDKQLKDHLRTKGPIGSPFPDQFERWAAVVVETDNDSDDGHQGGCSDPSHNHGHGKKAAAQKGKAKSAAAKKRAAASAAGKKKAMKPSAANKKKTAAKKTASKPKTAAAKAKSGAKKKAAAKKVATKPKKAAAPAKKAKATKAKAQSGKKK